MVEDSRAFWTRDPIVKSIGGVSEQETQSPEERALVAWIVHVFQVNRNLLHTRDPDLDIAGIELVIIASADPNAAARRSSGQRAVIVSLGLLRTLWRFLTAAVHHPDVLSRAYPLAVLAR